MSNPWTDIHDFVRKSQNLSSSTDVTKVQISITLIEDLLRRYPIQRLFSLISEAAQNDEDDRLTIGCDCLEVVLSSNRALTNWIDTNALLQAIEQGLQAQEIKILQVTLRFLRRISSDEVILENSTKSLFFTNEILHLLIKNIMSENIKIVTLTVDIIVALCGGSLKCLSSNFRGQIGSLNQTQPSSVADEEIERVLNAIVYLSETEEIGDSTSQIRICDLVSRICGISNRCLRFCDSLGLLNSFLACVISVESDPLLALNLIEFLPNLCSSSLGLEKLTRRLNGRSILVRLSDWARVPGSISIPVPSTASSSSFQDNSAFSTICSTLADDLSSQRTPENSRNEVEEDETSIFELEMFELSALSTLISIFERVFRADSPEAALLRPVLRAHLLPRLLGRCLKLTVDSSPVRSISGIGGFLSLLSADASSLWALWNGPARPALQRVLAQASSSHTEVRACVYASLARVFVYFDGSWCRNPPVSNISGAEEPRLLLLDLFGNLGKLPDSSPTMDGSSPVDSMALLLKELENHANPTTRLAAYDLLAALLAVPLPAAIRTAFAFPGFLQFLLRRDTEDSKLSKEMKFDVVLATLLNPASALLGESVLAQLRDFRERGPYLPTMVGPRVFTDLDA